MQIRDCFVLILAAAAAADDLATGRISNLICAAGLAAGFYAACREASLAAGLAHFALGALIPAAGGFILFRYRMIGAGDVKLLAAIGGLTGDGIILQFLLASFVCGGILALAIMLSCSDFRERAKVLSQFLMKQSVVEKPVSYRSVSRELSGTSAEFHFSVPVLMAAVLYAGGIF